MKRVTVEYDVRACAYKVIIPITDYELRSVNYLDLAAEVHDIVAEKLNDIINWNFNKEI